jgi:hypothetical protein
VGGSARAQKADAEESSDERDAHGGRIAGERAGADEEQAEDLE